MSSKGRGVRKYFYDSLGGQRHWESREALELLNVFENHHYLFGVMSSDEDVWVLMASALNDKGMEVTARQANKKWARMRETFQKIRDAKSSDASTKALQRPMPARRAAAAAGEEDVLQRYLAATRRPPRHPLSRPCRAAVAARPAAPATTVPAIPGPLERSRLLDDYETLRAMYKLSLAF